MLVKTLALRASLKNTRPLVEMIGSGDALHLQLLPSPELLPCLYSSGNVLQLIDCSYDTPVKSGVHQPELNRRTVALSLTVPSRSGL